MSATAESEVAESSNTAAKRVALLQGELEGLSCKLNGYERALQDCEFQLAERELQLVLLKSFIRNLYSPTELQVNLQEVLEHNTHLQQELAHTTIITPAPASTAMQVSLLRAALAEANYRLTAAGLLPVAAIGLQEEPKTQEAASLASNFTTSTPIIKRSFSRLILKYSTPSRTTSSTSTSASRPLSSTSSTITPSGSTGSKSSPCAPALSLVSKLADAAPAEGPETPVGVSGTNAAPRRATSCSEVASSCTTTPAPGRAAATASDLTAAVASSLSAAFNALAAVRPGGGGDAGTIKSAGDASTECTVGAFDDVEPYACAADVLSDGSSSSITSRQSAPASPNMRLLGSPKGKVHLTPPCSPCSSISCDSVGGSGMRRSYAAPAGLGRSLAAWPGVTCSCDNPLFVEHSDS